MTNPFHCPVAQGALVLDLKGNDSDDLWVNHCCLRKYDRHPLKPGEDIWSSPLLQPLRQFNKENHAFHPDCWVCEGNESVGLESFRTGMLAKYGYKTDYTGPNRIDVMSDISCNLACRTCGPSLSTFWQKHIRENNLPMDPRAPAPTPKAAEMIAALKTLDLSNLEDVVMCGGETLLGRGYLDVAEALAELVPHAKERLTLSFQTNGTMPINKRDLDLLSRFKLVKLHFSIDGTKDQFEYLRWPAKWDQVTENIFNLRETAPVNVMFTVEETISTFNLFYLGQVSDWVKNNFSTNRLGDIVNYTSHAAEGFFSLKNLTQEYVDNLPNHLKGLVKKPFTENPELVAKMVNEVKTYDRTRNQDWTKTFPEVAEFYKRYM